MKKQTSVCLEVEAIKSARAMGLNLSYEFNEHLTKLVKGKQTPATVRMYFLERENTELKERLREMRTKLEATPTQDRERSGGNNPCAVELTGGDKPDAPEAGPPDPRLQLQLSCNVCKKGTSSSGRPFTKTTLLLHKRHSHPAWAPRPDPRQE